MHTSFWNIFVNFIIFYSLEINKVSEGSESFVHNILQKFSSGKAALFAVLSSVLPSVISEVYKKQEWSSFVSRFRIHFSFLQQSPRNYRFSLYQICSQPAKSTMEAPEQ